MLQDKDLILQEFKMRQNQMKNINKALTDEIRKLNKSGHSTPSSGASSPVIQLSKMIHSRTQTAHEEFGSSSSSLEIQTEDIPDLAYLKAVILKFIEAKDKRVFIKMD
jgi:hypothetical protein